MSARGAVMEGFSASAWDAVVVGAGVAGAVAANGLARRGARVLLVERSVFPREKVCGCCLSAAAVEVLTREGFAHTIEQLGAIPVTRMSLLACGRSAEFEIPQVLAVTRGRLDSALVAEAVTAGVTFSDATGAMIEQGVLDGIHRVRLNRAEVTTTVLTRTVVAADGIGGNLLSGRKVFDWTVRRNSRIGLGALVPGSGAAPRGTVQMIVGQGAYVGLVDTGRNAFAVGVSASVRAVREAGSPGALVKRVLGENGISCDWAAKAEWHGTPLLTRSRECVGAGGIFAVGDATGYVEPFTGEGMAWAATGAAAGVPFILDAIAGNTDAASTGWNSSHRRLFCSNRRRCHLVAGVARHPWMAGAAAWLLSAIPSLGSAGARAIVRSLGTGPNYSAAKVGA